VGRPRAGWLAPTTPLGSFPFDLLAVVSHGHPCHIVTIRCNGGWPLAGPWPGVVTAGSPVSGVECRGWWVRWVRAGTHLSRVDPGPPGPTTCRRSTPADPGPPLACPGVPALATGTQAPGHTAASGVWQWPALALDTRAATLARPGPPWGVTTASALCVSPSHFPNKKRVRRGSPSDFPDKKEAHPRWPEGDRGEPVYPLGLLWVKVAGRPPAWGTAKPGPRIGRQANRGPRTWMGRDRWPSANRRPGHAFLYLCSPEDPFTGSSGRPPDKRSRDDPNWPVREGSPATSMDHRCYLFNAKPLLPTWSGKPGWGAGK